MFARIALEGGLGADYNEDLMSTLADVGLGRSYFVDKPEQLAGIFLTELSSLSTIVARGAVVELVPKNGMEIADVIGFWFEKSGDRAIISAGDIYASRTTDILVRLRVPAARGKVPLVDANMYVSANDAYNRNDFSAGDRILHEARARLARELSKQKVAERGRRPFHAWLSEQGCEEEGVVDEQGVCVLTAKFRRDAVCSRL